MRPARLCGCGSYLAKSEHRCPPCRKAHYLANYGTLPSESRITLKALADKRERIESMAALYRSGMTLQQIGDRYGVTRERVRQLIAVVGFTAKDGGNCVRAALKAKDRSARRDARYIRTHGMLHIEYRALVMNGATRAYTQQRGNALVRGIAWEFKNLSEWWAVWEQSGHWHKRGRGIGKYAMSRPGDVGPYSPGNVKIILATENSSEAIKRTIASGLMPHVARWSKCGRGIGFHYECSGHIRPFKVQALGRHIGQFDNALDARAAYLRACREAAA